MSNENIFAETKPINHDDDVDSGIRECLKLGSGQSFVTFAGAGSGKTYSLKKALDFLKREYFNTFFRQGKQIAVVTFTNNAADEITDRIEKSPIFAVSTVHSFCWSAIAGFNEDIRKWYLEKIPSDLADLNEMEKKGRAGKASDARKRTIIRLEEKIQWLSEPRIFVYDPSGINSSDNALSHADVLKIFANFLATKPMMGEIVVNKFPFIFIDESQDTNKDVMNAFFDLQKARADKVVIGLFGDTMQRIFGGGEPELGNSKPEDWTVFDKKMNHRSARRIIGLGNRIRSENDNRVQYAREGASDGCVRYFLIKNGNSEKIDIERMIRESMAEVSGDADWTNTESDETAVLLLEHKMAGPRLGFLKLWSTLSKSEKIRDQISEGTNTELNFFSNIVFPLADASQNQRRAELMSILRESESPLLETSELGANKDDPLAAARDAEEAFNHIISNKNVKFSAVLEVLAEHKLLKIPLKLRSFIASSNEVDSESKVELSEDLLVGDAVSEKRIDDEIVAWAQALETDFYQIRNYKEYVEGGSIFRTHQGVKGNEFERVMVIMDDSEAGGFLFSYEQYFGAKEISQASQKKLDAGEETGLDRTRRLFYVTSTRAKSSLAHVIYTSDVSKVKKNLIEKKFAQADEVEEL